jgi:choline kinase
MSHFRRKAVIFTSALGNQVSPISRELPKPFLSLDGTLGGPNFLDYHLLQLKKSGVEEIFIVGNQNTFGRRLKAQEHVGVKWILNSTQDLANSGSGHAAWCAWQSPYNILDSHSRVFLLDAGIFYDPKIFELLLRSPTIESKILVASNPPETDIMEKILVFSQPQKKDIPIMQGKGLLNSPLTNGFERVGEATGVHLFEPPDHSLLRHSTDWAMNFSTAKTHSELKDIIQQLMFAQKMRTVPFGHEIDFMECNTPADYRTLTTKLYPRLKHHLNL